MEDSPKEYDVHLDVEPPRSVRVTADAQWIVQETGMQMFALGGEVVAGFPIPALLGFTVRQTEDAS